MYRAVRRFRHMVEGREFAIYTDHKPLTNAFSRSSSNGSPRQCRHLEFIGQFTTDIRHVSGAANPVADALSRIAEVSSTLDYAAIARTQRHDAELVRFRESNTTGLVLRLKRIPDSPEQIWCDISTGMARPYITPQFRKLAFDSVHGLAHPGVRATSRMVAQRFVWPSIKKDCRRWARGCLSCQKNKISRHVRTPVGRFPLTSERFRHLHIDLVGPLRVSNGYRFCLTIIDRFIRWPEVVPLPDIEAGTVARALISGWISRYGVPGVVTTDQGRQFSSKLFTALARSVGFVHVRTTAYHPQSNGIIEAFHRRLKAALCCRADSTWSEALPWVLLGIRAAFRADLHASAAELTFGTCLRLPAEFLDASDTNRPTTDMFHVDYASDVNNSTTLGGTTIDLTFSRHIKLETLPFISYFSYHRSILNRITQIVRN